MENNELSYIKGMFDSIAINYDCLNRLLSLGYDVYWRSKMVLEVKKKQATSILDVACGTADIAIEIVSHADLLANVTGVDFSEQMLAIAREKIKKEMCSRINLVLADALSLPFTAESFDAITMAFGIRNIQNRRRVLRNLHSLLMPGGILLILELAIPKKSLIKKFFMFYFKEVLPKIGQLFSKNAFAYNYLPESVIKFHSTSDFLSMMIDSGFSRVSCKRLTRGVANLFIGYKL